MMISRIRRQLVKAGVICTVALASMFGMASSASAVTTLSKLPNQGPYWHPVDGIPFGTYVYANSFIMPTQTDTSLTSIGIWLRNENGSTGTSVAFELLSDNGNSPVGASLLASSAPTPFNGIPSLTLETLSIAPVTLTAGTRYWIAASAVGQPSNGGYQFGGHTQNTGDFGTDNGTFWYSNDPNGINFDGQHNTPEMAFQLTFDGGQAVPSPAASFLGLTGFGLLALRRQRKA